MLTYGFLGGVLSLCFLFLLLTIYCFHQGESLRSSLLANSRNLSYLELSLLGYTVIS